MAQRFEATEGSASQNTLGLTAADTQAWQGADRNIVQAQFTGNDQTTRRWGDRVQNERTLTLQYGDPDFDAKLARGGVDTLQINGMPNGVRLTTWGDQRGFYFNFTNGREFSNPHYIPRDLKSIVVGDQRREVDQMRAETFLAMAEPNSGFGFQAVRDPGAPTDGPRSPAIDYAFGNASKSQEWIQRMEATLQEGVRRDPNNAYMRLMLADMYTADAMKPIRDQAIAMGTAREPAVIHLDGMTGNRLNDAAEQIRAAQQIARQNGNFFIQMQADRRAALINLLPQALQAIGPVELPPANITGRSGVPPFEPAPLRVPQRPVELPSVYDRLVPRN